MNKKWLLAIVIVVLVVAVVGAGAAYAQGGRGKGNGGAGGGGNGGGGNGNGLGDGTGLGLSTGLPLTDEAIEALEAGLQDEYHAYATYGAIIDQFGAVAPFTTIQYSESQHIQALVRIFERYGLDVPEAEPMTVPTFDTLADACAAGAAAEIANFDLYDEWLETVSDYPDLVRVFTALRNASEFNHLPAFEACAALG
ncbi:MAG: hypothetical protein H6673_03785 [Anaerolineales bacterium]|nr:hypothetical protein [Anaerolineales bacterium]